MGTIRIKHNDKGYRELLKAAKVQADIARRAEAVASAAGPGFEARHTAARSRARSAVVATTREAQEKNSRDNTLVRSLDAGR